MESYFLTQLISLFVYYHILFTVAAIKKRNDLADVFWGVGFIIIIINNIIFNANLLNTILFFLVGIWGIRLFLHIGSRFLKKTKEDFRYAKWRADWGKWWPIRSYLKVFLLQGFFLVLIAIPLLLSGDNNISLSFINYLGILIWIFGFLFEVVSDWQLKNFVRTKKPGEIMQTGLWKYSRHPNYFGEVVLWWGVWLTTWQVDYFWLGIIGPLTITWLILKVSGVPMLEKKYEGNPQWEEYKKKTSAFFPMFQKK
jgi:steroid 5-alpha reductase family enzyme